MVSNLPTLSPQKKVEEYKKNFVEHVTHELRAPIVCIQKSIESIRKSLTGEQEKAYLDIAIRSTERLENLVNNILDISKMESGKINLRYDVLTVDCFIKKCVENFSVWTESKKIKLETSIPEEAMIVEADEERLQQVLSNLVANALKFTPRYGTIQITVKHVEEAGEGGKKEWLWVSVQDSGLGISLDDQKNLFQKFVIASSSSTDGEKSTGLGLAIAKQIVELRSGRIWIESELGKGSLFTFMIPTHPNTL